MSRITTILIVALLAWSGAARAQDDTDATEAPEEADAPAAPTPEGPGVAVVDTGTNAVGITIVERFNFLNGTTDISDVSDNNHGTTSSQIVNQEAPAIPQHQYVTSFESVSAGEAAVLRAANNPAVRIIAYSGPAISVPLATLPQASEAGKFIAIRTGNDSADNPAPATVAAHSLPGVVAVTGTNGSGNLLSDANACGVTSPRCVGVRGTTEFNNYGGTSFASARLAGIAAQVLRNAPFLSAEELAQVIFATARDTGDPRLGNGFIANAEQVINNPAGPSSVGGSSGSSLGTAALVVGAAAGAALLMDNDEELEKTLILDSFGRPFHVDLGELAKIDDERRSLSRFFDSLEQRHASARIQLDDTHTIEAAYVTSDLDIVDPGKYFAFDDDPAFMDTDMSWVLSLSGEHANGFHYQLDRNRDPSANFGVMDEVYRGSLGGRPHFLSGQSFAVPVLSFSSVADSISLGFQGDDGFGLDFGLVNTSEDREHGRESVAAVLEGSYRFEDRAEVSLQVGRLQEDGSLFGGSSNGAFSVDNTNTLAASISGALRLGARTHLIGNYGVARSDVDHTDTALLQNFSSVQSDWFGLGVVSDEVFDTGDQLGVAFSQPLRVTDGDVDLSVPYARDFVGNIYRNSERISLEPEGREYTLESYYLHPMGRRSSVGAYVMLRQEPNHVDSAGAEVTVLASYRAKF
ncbi:MAG TPA: S8 family serine peptidase [Arenicellales bacterium]|nr:S8 family serine peptidase [Arenicellales bacterium]